MSFFNIIPLDKAYYNYCFEDIPLRVVWDSLEVTPNVKVNKTELSDGKIYFTKPITSQMDSFKIQILLHKDDVVKGHFHEEYQTENPLAGLDLSSINTLFSTGIDTDIIDQFLFTGESDIADYYDDIKVTDLLRYVVNNLIIVTVHTDAADIVDGTYVVTDNSSRKQVSRDGYTLWELEFTRHRPGTTISYNFNNSIVKKAVSNYKKKAKAKAKAKSSATTESKLKKCDVKNLKYSKTKKVTTCVKYMQTLLKKKGYYKSTVDGWFGGETLKSVKKFQTDYKKKYKLRTDGKVDAKTRNAMSTVL